MIAEENINCFGKVSHSFDYVDPYESLSNMTNVFEGTDLGFKASEMDIDNHGERSGFNISCYVCDSSIDIECYEGRDLSQFLQTCKSYEGQSSVGCWRLQHRIAYSVYDDEEDDKRIVRKCAYTKPKRSCIYQGGHASMISHCFCNTTACNHSGKSILSKSNFIFFVLIETILAITYNCMRFY
ncbi:hypothetical protein SSS_09201 [Sarcoptes scabiei]|nr:hypothetical protein SSS_09201 [Sarcoptes scabiei]